MSPMTSKSEQEDQPQTKFLLSPHDVLNEKYFCFILLLYIDVSIPHSPIGGTRERQWWERPQARTGHLLGGESSARHVSTVPG